MRGVDVNGEARTARANGGARWLDFDTATQRFGLVTPGGVVGSTGVAGLTLGGGIGHLTAQHGLTCDNLVGAEIVTPDGTMVRANSDEIPSCCGASAAAGATSAWRRDWSSGCTHYAGSSAVASPTREQESAMGFAGSGTSPSTHRGT
jgi:FAD/FMN-containing dehydrogenase